MAALTYWHFEKSSGVLLILLITCLKTMAVHFEATKAMDMLATHNSIF
jgi:hypothetical protein